MDGRLKEPCPRPSPLPERGRATYGDLMVFAADAQVTIECDERKIEDLGRSIDGEPKVGSGRE